MLYRVVITLSGYATVDANSEEEAQQKALNLNRNDFNFEPFNHEVLEDADIYAESNDQAV